jgi:hypothetical protein
MPGSSALLYDRILLQLQHRPETGDDPDDPGDEQAASFCQALRIRGACLGDLGAVMGPGSGESGCSPDPVRIVMPLERLPVLGLLPRSWLTRAGETPTMRATTPGSCPSASSPAIRRLHPGRPVSHAAKPTLKAASSAGPTRWSQASHSFRVPTSEPGMNWSLESRRTWAISW